MLGARLAGQQDVQRPLWSLMKLDENRLPVGDGESAPYPVRRKIEAALAAHVRLAESCVGCGGCQLAPSVLYQPDR